MSKLLTPKFINTIPNLYDTQNIKDPICQVKLFLADSSFTWYIIEFDKENLNTCYGFVDGLESELGYFNLDELESVRGMFGLKVERDLNFKPTRLSEIKRSVA
ncbi:DUF2958 domain-containing protein [Aliarcobacter cryaerophilus]|uniref:DUF2958 domain-containing protein n=1 Tax=Aliarcobacter cryaerophilus TaxID=28198 RepID=A0A2S9SPY0_9BACT|nr:DUF2958 domain-containing protein [Aliarcobacter cryaerophilus]PRM88648.1 hypothetical protein CJ669_03180 [Aliarcobacter cryaerophilus]